MSERECEVPDCHNVVEDDEDFCERCDQFTHVRNGAGLVVASYDDFGNRVNLGTTD